jgi:hypothetical protein
VGGEEEVWPQSHRSLSVQRRSRLGSNDSKALAVSSERVLLQKNSAPFTAAHRLTERFDSEWNTASRRKTANK